MNPTLRCLPLVLAISLGTSGILVAADTIKPADLLPAKMVQATNSTVTDGGTGSWQINERGAVDGQAFNGFGVLMFDQRQQFYTQSPPQQSADGTELVITGPGANGINVIRRIRSMPKLGCARWIDILQNTSPAAVTANVTFLGRVNYAPLQVLGEQGTAVAGPLDGKTSLLLITAPPNRGANADLVVGFGALRGKTRPTIMNMSNQLMIQWSVTIPPGGAVALCHLLTEKPLGTAQAQLGKLAKAWRASALVADLSPALRHVLLNGPEGGNSLLVDETALVGGIPDDLVEARGEDNDLLALGAGTRLRGEATGGDLQVSVDGKPHQLAWKEVLAIAGGSAPRVFLRDGAVLAGLDPAAPFRFALATGQNVELTAGRIGWLVRRPQPQDGLPPGEILIETADRQRIVGRPSGTRLRLATLWGPLELRLEDIASLAPSEGGASLVALRDGSRFTAMPTDGLVEVETRLAGKRGIPMNTVVGVVGEHRAPVGDAATAEEAPPKAPTVLLIGGQQITGVIDLPELHLRLEGNRLPLAPPQIRRLANQTEELDGWRPRQPRMRVELWTGDVADGLLEEVLIPVRTAGGRLMVPASDLVEATIPTPVIAPATRARIAELVLQLGDPAWTKREAAVKALARLGEVVRQDVEDAQRTATDPEVKARLDQVLQGLK